MVPKFILAGHTPNESLSRMSRLDARQALEGYDGLWIHRQFGCGPEVEAFILISEAASRRMEIIITVGRGPSMEDWRKLRREYATIKDIPLCVEIDDLPVLLKLVYSRLIGGSK